MPSYVSHTLMAHDVYDKLGRQDISLAYMLTFSLGADLSKYSKCRYDSHHKDMDKFISNMAEYIKDNKLTNDGEALGLLYGHICHYVMDDTVHPLIKNISKNCLRNKHNHALIEGYYDSYLVKKELNISIDKYDNKFVLSGSVNSKVAKIIDYAYFSTYGVKNVSRYYKFNIWLYRKIKYLYKVCSLNFLKRVSGFNKFTRNNNIDICNNNHEIKYCSCDKVNISSSLEEVYDVSVEKALKYISSIDKYLKNLTNVC